ncbi:uncharacterized protein LOC143276835 [Babylonia areolata]|uniref:uncharacterized protein LOC143276835 n=1 Tax=Babylonia areolata TaxID=304850 RepID=UPI003FD138DB
MRRSDRKRSYARDWSYDDDYRYNRIKRGRRSYYDDYYDGRYYDRYDHDDRYDHRDRYRSPSPRGSRARLLYDDLYEPYFEPSRYRDRSSDYDRRRCSRESSENSRRRRRQRRQRDEEKRRQRRRRKKSSSCELQMLKDNRVL